MIRERSRVSINILGTPEILLSGRPLALNHQKASALLFFLAATGKPHTRDYLATLLWGETGASEARHSLRSSLYRLRQGIQLDQAEEILVSNGEFLCLQSNTYDCDVSEFHRLLTIDDEQSLRQAVALYRGSLLQGFTLTQAPMFEEWVRTEGTRLNQSCFNALDRLVNLAESREEWAASIGFLQQMIRMDPLAETTQQRLMGLYLRKGEVGLALRQYRQFENQLRRELEIEPAAETQAFFQEILRQKWHSTSAAKPLPSFVHHASSLPFVGRDQLLEELTMIANRARTGQEGTIVLVQGEGGIGKSRLIEEFAARLISGWPLWQVLYGACSPFDDLLSHGPFLEALQSGISEDLTDLLTESDTALPDARGRFSWRVLQTIQESSRTAPLLLIIEDLQWANSSTLNLFGFLSMRIRHLPVILAGTVQHAEAIPALQRLITLKRRRGELYLFPLASLRLEDVTDLIRSSGIHSTSLESFAEWLHARSMGSPFLLNEILAQLRTEGILQSESDGWQLNITHWLRWRANFKLPETSHDLVGWRLANLSAEALHLLNVLAVAGQPLPVNILDQFPHIRASAFPNTVDDLAGRGLILELADGTLALPHHLLRETLLHRLSNLRRRAVYRQLAEALEAHTSLEEDALLRQMAIYSVAGEDIPRARRYGMHLLPSLPQEYTGAETMDFVHHLHDLLASGASTDEMIRLTRALGTLHQSLGHLEVAAQWHGQNLHWAQKAGDLAAQVDAHFEMSELALMSNDYQAAAHAAQEGLSIINTVDSSDALYSVLHPLDGIGHRLLGAAFAMEGSDLAAAESHLQKAVLAYHQTGNQSDLCAALFELGNIAAQRGELQHALNLYEESARAAEIGRIHYYFALARNNFAYHSLLLGNVNAAQQSVNQGVKVAESYDLLAALLHLYSTKGEIHLYLGEWGEAEESFRNGLAIAEDLGSLERQAGYRAGLALVARGHNDLDRSISLIREALALIEGQGYWHLHTRLQLWLAEMLFEQSRFIEAAKPLEEALAFARAHRRTLLLVQGERLRANLLAANGEWPAANQLFAETLDIASSLGLPLEIARVQAAWGKAALQYSSAPEEGRALIATARTILVAHNSRSDLSTLT
jgi:DNA-binding SARP family transcriptional activator